MDRRAELAARAAASAENCRRVAQRLRRGLPTPREYVREQRRGFVYFIQSDAGPVKIGWALSPTARRCELQTAHFAPLSILATVEGTKQNETSYHKRFAAHRLHGEWFAPHSDILAEIERLNDLAPKE